MATKQILATGCAGILGVTAVVLAAPAAGAAPTSVQAGVHTAAVALATPAAAPAREVEREIRGRGAAGSEWEFNLEKQGSYIDVDLDVESRVAGQRWDVRLYHNGNRVTKVVRTTDREGEFELDRTRPNKKGKDTLRFKATSSSGEVLTGKIRI